MKKLLQVFVSTAFLLLLLPRSISAAEKPILFWGVSCPYCHTVKEKIAAEHLQDKVGGIVEYEVQENTENLDIFEEKLQLCNVDIREVGIPLLFVDGKCFRGVGPIMEKLRSLSNEETSEEVDGSSMNKSDALEKGKTNTEKMIVAVGVFLAVLPLFGYFVKRKRGMNIVIAILLLAPFLFASPTYAICPLCTAAVGAGVGFSRYLGIDDTIIGVWVGGLLVSSCMWLFEWLKSKRRIRKKKQKWFAIGVFLLMYAFVLIPLRLKGIIGHPLNTLWGVDKMLFGIFLGSFAFFFAGRLHFYLKKQNKGKSYIPYQKVVMPVGAMWLATIFLYLMVYYWS